MVSSFSISLEHFSSKKTFQKEKRIFKFLRIDRKKNRIESSMSIHLNIIKRDESRPLISNGPLFFQSDEFVKEAEILVGG